MKDTARVLGRMYDGIEYRGFGQEIVEELGQYAGQGESVNAYFLTALNSADKTNSKYSVFE